MRHSLINKANFGESGTQTTLRQDSAGYYREAVKIGHDLLKLSWVD